ncbi:hypothetical protein GCM10009601_18380 [Streptomyces thermospinosisporus]|uniref:Uncharacterized protein n=1 Tax=Streptomyces thermospinosisporus TaxID=161482 RepID=A0ABP4JF01_9ACTN
MSNSSLPSLIRTCPARVSERSRLPIRTPLAVNSGSAMFTRPLARVSVCRTVLPGRPESGTGVGVPRSGALLPPVSVPPCAAEHQCMRSGSQGREKH